MLAATFGTVLVATTLLALTSLYAALVTESGLRRALTEAPPDDRVLLATGAVDSAAAVEAADAQVRVAVADAFAPIGADVTTSVTSASYGLAPGRGGEVSELVVFAWYDDLVGHATLQAGSWPAPSPTGTLDVALPTAAAEGLGLAPGDTLRVTGQLGDDAVRFRVSGTYDADRPDEPYWLGDPLGADGVDEGTSFTTYGPLVVPRETGLDRFAADASAGWRIVPDLAAATTADLPELRSGVAALGSADSAGTLSDGLDEDVLVDSGLPALLDEVDRPLLVLRSTVTVPAALLVVLAVVTLLQCTRLLAAHRAAGSALMRARGGSTRQLAGQAVREAVVLTVPAALAAPWLAALLLRASDGLGPLSDDGVPGSSAAPGLGTWVVAAVVGLGAAVLLVVRAVGATDVVSVRQASGRPSRSSTLQRSGGDLVLVLVAALAAWQLARYGAPVVGDASGRLDVDPLLVLAPAVLVTAGAVLALRLLPVLTLAADRLAGWTRGAVPALGVWRFSRRTRELAGPAVLLALATATGVFATVFAGGWAQSRVDQAEFAAGAELRLESLPDTTPSAELEELPGVTAVTPVLRDAAAFGEIDAEVLAVDASAAPDVLLLRGDLADRPVEDLFAELVDRRTEQPGLPLPPRAQQVVLPLRLTPRLAVERALQPVGVNLVVQDEAGLVHRLEAVDADLDGERGRLRFTLGRYRPSALLGVELSVDAGALGPLRFSQTLAAQEAVELSLVPPRALSAGGDDLGSLLLPSGARWEAGLQSPGGRPEPDVTIRGGGRADAVRAVLRPGCCQPVTYVLQASTPAAGDGSGVLPALVTEELAAAVGDAEAFVLESGGAAVELRVTGVLDALPGVAAGTAGVVVDSAGLADTVYRQSGDVLSTGEWWAATSGDPAVPAAAVAADERLAGASATFPDPASDPVGEGVSGALGIGAGAAAVLAVLGFALASVVSVRGRRGEVLVLEAVGVGSRAVRRLLVVEQVTLLALGVGLGAVVGLLAARFVVPLVTLSSTAQAPVPDVVVDVPWALVGAYVAGVAVASAGVVGLVLRAARGPGARGRLEEA